MSREKGAYLTVMEHIPQVVRKKLLDYLPAIYQDPGDSDHPNYLPTFLEPFEKILLGGENKTRARAEIAADTKLRAHTAESLSEKIGRLHELFDPQEAPEDFLPWLASWAALALRPTLDLKRKRLLISKIISLYPIRGTRAYVQELLNLCVDIPATVNEEEIAPLQLGVHSTVGRDMYIGGGPPHFFRVGLVASTLNAIEVQAQRQLAYEVVEFAKPAHTGYEFEIDSPEMQVGVHSTVGLDTVLGAPVQLEKGV